MTCKFSVLVLAGGLFAGLLAVPALAVDDEKTFDQVIQKRCIGCHTRERIDQARLKGENLQVIEQKMLSLGAQLSEKDRSVLGTFWGSPLKKQK